MIVTSLVSRKSEKTSLASKTPWKCLFGHSTVRQRSSPVCSRTSCAIKRKNKVFRRPLFKTTKNWCGGEEHMPSTLYNGLAGYVFIAACLVYSTTWCQVVFSPVATVKRWHFTVSANHACIQMCTCHISTFLQLDVNTFIYVYVCHISIWVGSHYMYLG